MHLKLILLSVQLKLIQRFRYIFLMVRLIKLIFRSTSNVELTARDLSRPSDKYNQVTKHDDMISKHDDMISSLSNQSITSE
jgi:hypothetical protein